MSLATERASRAREAMGGIGGIGIRKDAMGDFGGLGSVVGGLSRSAASRKKDLLRSVMTGRRRAVGH